MVDEYTSITSDDPRSGLLTYPQLQARRAIAVALATRNRPYPKTIGEGLTALGEGLGEGYLNRNLDVAERAQQARDTDANRRLEGSTAAPPAGGASIEGDPTQALAMAPPETEQTSPVKLAAASQKPQMDVEELTERYARNESGGAKDPYSLIGPVSRRGDSGYGKYQVMGRNVPVWTAQYLGKEMTPKEFLLDKKAQDDLARARGGELLDKYGPDGAAAAWFAGEKGMKDPNRKDVLGTTVAEYVRRFNTPLESRKQIVGIGARAPVDPETAAPVQVASLGGGMPTQDTAPDVARDAVAQSVLAQQGVQPPPQQVAQARGLPPPPQQQLPTVTPQTIPPAPAQPVRPLDPGQEPKPETFLNDPRIKPLMDEANRQKGDTALSPAANARAKARYDELRDIAKDNYTRQWTVWHERTKLKEADRLTADKREIETQAARGKAYDEAEQRVLKYRFGGVEPAEGFKKLATEQGAADLAGKVREDNRIILQAVRDGVIMGTGAGWRVQANKLAAWALQNGYASEQAANTEILRALGGSRIRESLAQINPTGVASNTDLLLARQLSGAEATMEPKAFLALLHKSSEYNAKLIDKYEGNKDYYLSGTRAERQFDLVPHQTGPKAETDKMLANRDDKALRAAYDDKYGEGSSALEIERFNRRQRRGQ